MANIRLASTSTATLTRSLWAWGELARRLGEIYNLNNTLLWAHFFGLDSTFTSCNHLSLFGRDQIKYVNDLRANSWSEVAVERHIVDGLMVQEAALVMNNVAEEEEEDEVRLPPVLSYRFSFAI